MDITVLAPFDANHDYTKSISGAVACLNRGQQQFRFRARRWRTEESDSEITRAEVERYAQTLRTELHLPPDNFFLAVVPSRLEGDWFSFVSHPARCGFVTIAGWFLFSHFPIESFLALEFIQNLQEYLLNWTDYSYAHLGPRGCLNDLCEFKRDISLKIQSGYVCPECRQAWSGKLSQAQIDALTTALDHVRELALGRLPAEEPPEEQMAFPVAVTWRLLRLEQEPTRQFSRLLDLFDMAVRFTVVVLITDLLFHREMRGEEVDTTQFFHEFVPERPSLGSWVDALPELFARLRKDPTASSFSQPILDSVREAAQIIQKCNLVKLRNDTKGHALTLAPGEYARLFEDHWQDVEKVLRALREILTVRLLRLATATYERAKNRFHMQCRLLMGSNQLFGAFDFFSTKPEEPDTVMILHEGSSRPVPLYKLIRWAACPLCKHEAVLVTDDGGNYLDPAVGHRVRLTD
jgi:hypothetical protein